MTRRQCRSCLCLLTWAFIYTSAHLSGQSDNLLFHHVSVESGLSESTNEFVCKDSEGFIWISSINGLNRFDGIRIKKYMPDPQDSTALQGQYIQSRIFEDSNDGFWLSTYEGGLNYYDRKKDEFSSWRMYHDNAFVKDGYHLFDIDQHGRLWVIVADSMICTFDKSSHQYSIKGHLTGKSQRAISIKDSQGNIWKIFSYKLNSAGVNLTELDEEGNPVVIKKLFDGDDELVIIPRKIIRCNDQEICIAGTKELIFYNPVTSQSRVINTPQIRTVECGKDGLIYVSVLNDGVHVFDPAKMKFVTRYLRDPNNPMSITSNFIDYISVDDDGGLWFSSNGRGINFTHPRKKKFNLIRPAVEEEDFNPSILEKYGDNVFCAMTGHGIYFMDQTGKIISQNKKVDIRPYSDLNKIENAVVTSGEAIWLYTFSETIKLPSPDESPVFLRNDTVSFFDGIALTDHKIICTGTQSGLYEFTDHNDDYNIRLLSHVNGADKTVIEPYIDRKGRLWLNENVFQTIIVDTSDFSIIQQIPGTGFTCGYAEDAAVNSMWIAGSNGLFQISLDSLGVQQVLNEKNGWPASSFTNMVMDKRGRLWMTTQSNLLMYDTRSGNYKLYDLEDGLPAAEFYRRTAVQFNDGEIWFGSPGGIVSFHPDKIQSYTIDAIPQVTSLLINDKPFADLTCEKSGARNITAIEKLTFNYTENTLSFIVNAMEYSAPKNNVVYYRMDNLENEWVATSNGNEVRYPNLSPGRYTFMVKAANSDGIINENNIRTIEITIVPPYYKTWWFMSLMILSGLSLLALLIYLRVSKAIEVQKVRLRLYENLHDDVGSRLTSIAMSADMLREEVKDNPNLNRLSGVARSIVGNMKRLVWAIDPVNESMESLLLKIRDDKNQTLDPRIKFTMESDPSLLQKIIPGEIRYQLVSVTSEAFHNISKYAQATEVDLRFQRSGKHLVMTIRDNGVGFDPATVQKDNVKASGYGLGNMSKRLSRVKGEIKIESAPGKGTLITASVPFK